MIEIYGKPMCALCDKAKALCENLGLEYTYKSLGTDYTMEELLENFPGARTVPQIKIDGKSIGGFTELEEHVKK